jgi:hypothetical protein
MLQVGLAPSMSHLRFSSLSVFILCSIQGLQRYQKRPKLHLGKKEKKSKPDTLRAGAGMALADIRKGSLHQLETDQVNKPRFIP